MNPYATEQDEIPQTDKYLDIPLYGRYCPKQDDFRVDRQHINSQCPDSLRYWASVLELCDESVRIYPAGDDGRDIFAIGSVIIKSSHLRTETEAQYPEIDYSYADSNELHAISIAKTALKDVRVPEIYFAGKIHGRQVLVQERLPGVALAVAWPYLSPGQKASFKYQARDILRRMQAVKPPDNCHVRTHIVQDPNILNNGRIQPLEGEILFSKANIDPDMGFMHNDLTESNCIVDNDKIVGLIDWEMAGFFGRKTAGEVHRRIRTPQRENFAKLDLSEEKLQDICFWNDLYDHDMPENKGEEGEGRPTNDGSL